MNTLTADALRIELLNLDRAIKAIRRKIAQGEPVKGVKYRDAIRKCHEFRDRGLAEGRSGTLWIAPAPMPINDGVLVPSSFTAEERFAAFWHIEPAPRPLAVAA